MRSTLARLTPPGLSRRGVVAALLAVTGALGIPACSTSGPAQSELDHVRAIVMPYLTLMPFYIAQEEGFFEQEGLDVEFIRLSRSQEIMTALATGAADVAGGMLTVNELALAATGARVRLVASFGDLMPDECPTAAFMVRREHLESGALEDPEQIRRLRFDTDELTVLGYWTEELVRPLGLTFDDLELANLPSPAALQGLAGGLIDVTVDSEPFLSMHEATGQVAVWKQVGEVVPGFGISMMIYGANLLDDRPEVGERFAVAMLRAIRQFASGKTDRNRAIVENATSLDPEMLFTACWPFVRADARLRPAVFRGYQEWSVARGLVERVLEDDELFDHRFIDHANAQLAR